MKIFDWFVNFRFADSFRIIDFFFQERKQTECREVTAWVQQRPLSRENQGFMLSGDYSNLGSGNEKRSLKSLKQLQRVSVMLQLDNDCFQLGPLHNLKILRIFKMH